MKFLFLCSSNINRSKSAETYFSGLYPEHAFQSAGLNEKSCRDNGTNFATESMLDDADRIFVMEEKHREWIEKATGTRFSAKITVLHIPDIYQYMDTSLTALLAQIRL